MALDRLFVMLFQRWRENRKGFSGSYVWLKNIIGCGWNFYFIASRMLKKSLIVLRGLLKLVIRNESFGNFASKLVR
jgi:hypothetical protein